MKYCQLSDIGPPNIVKVRDDQIWNIFFFIFQYCQNFKLK